jgi:hypothetical protein
MPLRKEMQRILREIRDETARKVRLQEFAERMPVERYRATEASLARFTEAMDVAIEAVSEEEGGTDDDERE